MRNVIILLIPGIILIVVGLLMKIYSSQIRYPAQMAEATTTVESILFASQNRPPKEDLQEITTIDQVFSSPSSSERTTGHISLLATGDVLLARSINYKMVQLQDFSWPFISVAELLKKPDITFINLETPLISDCPTRIDGMLFCGDLRSVQSLQFAGIDVVNLANNHASNFGPDGVVETDQILRSHNIVVSGIDGNNAGFKTVKDTTFAFLGYNEVNEQLGITKAVDHVIEKEIRAVRSQAEVVVVQFHWGNEYTYTPSENQKRLARLAIDAGADLIIGNHPHWYQPIEFYKGKLIVYSHGNLVFDQMWSRETREGIMGEYIFSGNKLVGVQFVPILIENYGQPRVLENAEGEKILENLKKQSYLLQ